MQDKEIRYVFDYISAYDTILRRKHATRPSELTLLQKELTLSRGI